MSEEHCEKSSVSRRHLKVGSVDAEVIAVSRLLQMLAAATENIQSLMVSCAVRGTIRLVFDEESRCHCD
jgi:hypothetical protein